MLTCARGLAFITLVAALSGSAAVPTAPTFLAVVRDGQSTWLLPDDGSCLFLQTRSAKPQCQLRLRTAGGAPFSWSLHPTSFAAWRGGWIFANGENRLWRFSATGLLLDTVRVPDRITDIVSAGTEVWLYSSLPSVQKGGERLWLSRDLSSFTLCKAALIEETADTASMLVSGQLVLAPGRPGHLAVIHAIGAPAAVIASPEGIVRTIPLAYSRSAARNALLHYRPGDTDLTTYSAPARDALFSTEGDLFVLRNREDAAGAAGTQLQRGLRVDRYDAGGVQRGTAVLPASARFILRADARSVTTLSDRNEVEVARFGEPMKGIVLR
jgi:hypothetical protein